MNIGLLLKQPNPEIDIEFLKNRYQIIINDKITAQQVDFLLIIDENGLSLQQTSEKNFKPLYIDFSSNSIQRRQIQNHSELIKKAVGSIKNPTILDATAGLGRDAFILASIGYQVTLVEKNPIIAELLKNGIERADKITELKPIINKMHLIEADSIQYMQQLIKKPDIVYLDPMFPERKKSAKVKKEMQILKKLLGKPKNQEKLFQIALKTAQKRIIVKRPRIAPTITEQKPTYQLIGKTCRFDIYVTSLSKKTVNN